MEERRAEEDAVCNIEFQRFDFPKIIFRISNDILLQDEKSHLRCVYQREGKSAEFIMEFLELLKRRENWYQNFMQVLIQENLSDIADATEARKKSILLSCVNSTRQMNNFNDENFGSSRRSSRTDRFLHNNIQKFDESHFEAERNDRTNLLQCPQRSNKSAIGEKIQDEPPSKNFKFDNIKRYCGIEETVPKDLYCDTSKHSPSTAGSNFHILEELSESDNISEDMNSKQLTSTDDTFEISMEKLTNTPLPLLSQEWVDDAKHIQCMSPNNLSRSPSVYSEDQYFTTIWSSFIRRFYREMLQLLFQNMWHVISSSYK